MQPETGLFERARRFVTWDLWNATPNPRRLVQWGRSTLQVAVSAVHGAFDDQILLRASSLTYYTALSLIPLLAIAMSIVGALGIRENVAESLVGMLAAVSPEAQSVILEYVGNVRFGALGTIGAAVLFVTTILGISSIEHSLNTLWNVERPRSLARRLPDYLAVVVVAPVVLGVAVSLGTTLQNDRVVVWLLQFPYFAQVYNLGLQQMPIVFLTLGLGFLYWFLPNTRVRISSALLGGVVGAVLFTVAQKFYIGLQVGVARSSVLFGAVFFLPVLFVWIYTSWVIVLFGGEVAYSHQSLKRTRRAWRGPDPSAASREAIAVAVSLAVAREFRQRGRGSDLAELEQRLDIPYRSIRSVVNTLLDAGVLAPRGAESADVVQLGRAAESIRVLDVLAAVRGDRVPIASDDDTGASVDALLADADRSVRSSLGERTLADFAGARSYS